MPLQKKPANHKATPGKAYNSTKLQTPALLK